MQALAAEVVALEEKSLEVRVRELRLEKELARAKESLQHMQRQLENLTRDRGDLAQRLSTVQVKLPSLYMCCAVAHASAVSSPSVQSGTVPLSIRAARLTTGG